MHDETEPQAVAERYARRQQSGRYKYEIRDPAIWQTVQERERGIIRVLGKHLLEPIHTASLLEIGCGSGNNILELIRLGFQPKNIAANELLPERLSAARSNLPDSVKLYPGDAAKLTFPDNSFDIVFQSTVFTSLLSDEFRRLLARKMWDWTKLHGGILWYDFTFDNPRNPDVRRVTPAEIRRLFPDATIHMERVTLAPPISRRVTRIHPQLYHLFNFFPLLRTHVLCWIGKGSR